MKKDLYYFLILVFIFTCMENFTLIGESFGFKNTTIDNINKYLFSIISPLTIIIYTLLIVNNDKKESKRKNKSYIFTYFIFLPCVVFYLIYGITQVTS